MSHMENTVMTTNKITTELSPEHKYRFTVYKDEVELYPETEFLNSGRILYTDDDILAILLLEEKIFINNHWWENEWTNEQQQLFSINVECNDVFVWASADAEELLYNELQELWEYFKKDPIWGCTVWCIVKRNMMPQKPVYDVIMASGIWDLDSMNLDPN